MDQFYFYFKLGLTHVLDWNAYDHVLFFIALTIFYTLKDWKKALWVVTAFTIGHMLSLGLAAYNVFKPNMAVIEFLIPLSIFLTGAYNIATVSSAQKSLQFKSVVSFVFGLIHGVGFSNYFGMILDESENKLVQLLEFAVGIEIAQFIVVVVMLLLGYVMINILKRPRRDWIIIISAIVMGIVIPMLIERKFW